MTDSICLLCRVLLLAMRHQAPMVVMMMLRWFGEVEVAIVLMLACLWAGRPRNVVCFFLTGVLPCYRVWYVW